uniref:DNA-directed RNA polymerase subunit alpha n=1 Tax=Neglectella solitaria TaxID=120749 RepID=C7BED9_NEGSO|nr:alpha subunit of RNA polymerase [Neglectella solitaria]
MEIFNETKNVTLCCIESRIEENKNFYGRFILGPFEVGQGLTLANSLRRTLLSEISGLAIVAMEIEGALHEYSNLPGVQESILDILLNLKQIVLVSRFEMDQPVFGFLKVQGPGIVTASDLKLPSSIQCVDPHQYIATLSYNGFLSIKFFVCQKKNYIFLKNASLKKKKIYKLKKNKIQSPILEKKKSNFLINKTSNVVSIDPNFFSVNKVNYLIETCSLFLFEKPKEQIFLEIWTNGSLHPRQAINEAAKRIVNIFSPFQETRFYKPGRLKSSKLFSLKRENFKKFTSLDIANLDLSLRSYTCLKRANIHTIDNLLQYSSEELLLLKNFGTRSLEEVLNILQQIGLNLRDFDKDTK